MYELQMSKILITYCLLPSKNVWKSLIQTCIFDQILKQSIANLNISI